MQGISQKMREFYQVLSQKMREPSSYNVVPPHRRFGGLSSEGIQKNASHLPSSYNVVPPHRRFGGLSSEGI